MRSTERSVDGCHRPQSRASCAGGGEDRLSPRARAATEGRLGARAAAAGSGHPTSSMSAADLMAVLLDGYLRLDYSDPDDPHRDHLIFSKGHASPLYYSMLKAVGEIDDAELLTFRKFGSRLEGHPTPDPSDRRGDRVVGAGLPIGVGSPSPAGALTACRTACGCCAAIPRWPRARSGRRSSTPAGSGSTISSRSSTSTAWGRRARRCSAGTCPDTRTVRGRSAGTRSRSTATMSTRSTPPTGTRSRRAASRPSSWRTR